MRPLLITGATGTLGRAFERICGHRGLAAHVTTREELDIADRDAVAEILQRLQPWLVVNAAGYVRVDEAEHDRERCLRENVIGPEVLARCCARDGVGLISFSSDLVFDGMKGAPYDERDQPRPLGVYGESKYEAEQRILDAHGAALVIRTSAFFGPWDAHNFAVHCVRELAAGHELRAASDTIVSPTYVPDLVHASLDLAIDAEAGVWHLANAGATSWANLARSIAERRGYSAALVTPVAMDELAGARRPPFSALASARGAVMPALANALDRFHQEYA